MRQKTAGMGPTATELGIATYNIHGSVGRDGRFAPERVIGVIRELNADALALQEVEMPQPGELNMALALERELGGTALIGPTITRETGNFGNVLWSHLPILEYRCIELGVPGREPRGAVDAILDWHGRQVHVVATHLGLNPGERRQQVRWLLKLFETSPADFDVLMGDVNEWFLWGRPLRWLHAKFRQPPAVATFPAGFPVFALDRIWVRPRNLLAAVRAHRSPLARVASDHLPLQGFVRLT